MKIHRFISTLERVGTKMAITDENLVFQIHTVLKLEPGEQIDITDGKGKITHCQILSCDKEKIEVLELSIHTKIQEQKLRLHAFLAILKKDNFELAVQKMTELGITDITPIITDRTIKKGLDTLRLERIIKEAVEQSGQSILPVIHEELDFDQAIYEAVRDYGHIVCFEEEIDESHDQSTPSKKTPNQNNLRLASLAFFVGPEGGWTDRELELFDREKAIRVSLGDTTLRGETAAIVGTFYLKRLQK